MMKSTKCLYCYEPIKASEQIEGSEYHLKCSQIFFRLRNPPLVDFTQDEIYQLATLTIKSKQSVTGAQTKLSLETKRISSESKAQRLTFIGLWGQYILKPQTELYQQLPENEDLTMHLAASAKIKTVPHSLIRLKSGELAYITKRVDRKKVSKKRSKIHMEDMCQLSNRLTEHKYRGSYEQIAKVVNKNCQNAGLDLFNFYELLLFCFLTGNNDMHLKNFSLLKNPEHSYDLCPAYDLIASELVMPGDDEELALNLNEKKRSFRKKDFQQAMQSSGINPQAIKNIFNKFSKFKNQWFSIIDRSFLSKSTQEEYKTMVIKKFKQLEMGQ